MNKTYYVGLDVHKDSIAIAYTPEGSRQEPTYYGECGGSILAAERTLRKVAKLLGQKLQNLKVCYEAGPTGFVLARRLLQLKVDCCLMAPSKTERKPNEAIKTDKRDAKLIAKLFRNGDITPVRIPPVLDEAVRDLCRARTDASDDLSRSKQRLKLTLESWDWKPVVLALMACKAFKEVAAMTIISALGDLRRFSHPRKLMAFLGLVPGEHSSGCKRRQGSITKCGNSHARWMLVECAQHYRRAPKVSKELTTRQAGQSKEVKELSWRMQNRLSKRYQCLRARGIMDSKCIVAIARELSGFIWELQNKCQLPMPENEGRGSTRGYAPQTHLHQGFGGRARAN